MKVRATVWCVHLIKVGTYRNLISQSQYNRKTGHSDAPKCSVMRVSAMAVPALDAASPHRVDQVGEDPLWNCLPLSVQHLVEVLGIPGRGVVAPHSSIQLIPEVLNRIKIGTACWPPHSVDSRLLQEVVDHSCPVGASVIILVDSSRSNQLQCRHSQGTKDLIAVSKASQVTLYMIQGCSVVQAEGPPYHYRTSTKGHFFLDSGVNKALPWAPPDPQSAVVVVQGEA